MRQAGFEWLLIAQAARSCQAAERPRDSRPRSVPPLAVCRDRREAPPWGAGQPGLGSRQSQRTGWPARSKIPGAKRRGLQRVVSCRHLGSHPCLRRA